ncbi:hypothetical protein BaRGS_00012556 [Batillaria attramentaria]|uniref:Uncharacterized protein n=1 Tax=Batillaria attramentaria TaxID=370345 RepID=A0ABD0LA41_9CAEN
MSASGLSSTASAVLETLLESHEVKSWKITSEGKHTTFVLRLGSKRPENGPVAAKMCRGRKQPLQQGKDAAKLKAWKERKSVKHEESIDNGLEKPDVNFCESVSCDPKTISKEPLASSSVSKEPLASSSVSKEQLAPSSISKDHLASSSVSKEPLASSSVSKGPLASSSVSKEPLASSSVSKEPLASSSVSKEPLASSFVSKESVASSSISKGLLASNFVSKEPVASSSTEDKKPGIVVSCVNTKVTGSCRSSSSFETPSTRGGEANAPKERNGSFKSVSVLFTPSPTRVRPKIQFVEPETHREVLNNGQGCALNTAHKITPNTDSVNRSASPVLHPKDASTTNRHTGYTYSKQRVSASPVNNSLPFIPSPNVRRKLNYETTGTVNNIRMKGAKVPGNSTADFVSASQCSASSVVPNAGVHEQWSTSDGNKVYTAARNRVVNAINTKLASVNNNNVTTDPCAPTQRSSGYDKTVNAINQTPDAVNSAVTDPFALPSRSSGFDIQDIKTRVRELATKVQPSFLKMERRNAKLIKIAMDTRQNKQMLVGQSDDFVVVRDCKQNKAYHWFFWRSPRKMTNEEVDIMTCLRLYRLYPADCEKHVEEVNKLQKDLDMLNGVVKECLG